MMASDYLTKSDLLSGLQCRKKLWLLRNRPDLASPPDPVRQRAIEQGNAVGVLARERFPGGRLVASRDPQDAIEETRAAIEAGESTLFEAAFSSRGVYVRLDVLTRIESGWALTEVKSSSRRKPEHIPDVAVQRYACEGSGVTIAQSQLMHLNREVVWPDEAWLFETEDIGVETLDWLGQLPPIVAELSAVPSHAAEPVVPIGTHCTNPYECPFKSYCWQAVPSPSIFDIPSLSGDLRNEYAAKGILAPEDLPEDDGLKQPVMFYRDLYRSRAPVVDWDGIGEMFSRLKEPLYFLDFETDNPALPRYDGTSPYQHIPFQYSLHVVQTTNDLDAEEPECRHHEYLHRDRSDPRVPLAERLVSDLGESGSIIAYWAGFEKAVIRGLSESVSHLAPQLDSLEERFWDLYTAFKRHYEHPDFRGSKSLKRVLPVLVPSLSYEGMEVADGAAAQVAWNRLLETGDDDEADRLTRALLVYCRQDTYAMVVLSAHLYRELKRRRES